MRQSGLVETEFRWRADLGRLAEITSGLAGSRSFKMTVMRRRLPVAECYRLAVDVELEQLGGMIGEAASRRRRYAIEAQSTQVKFIDEHVDHPHGFSSTT